MKCVHMQYIVWFYFNLKCVVYYSSEYIYILYCMYIY